MDSLQRVVDIKREIVQALLAGLLLGFISLYLIAFLALLVWYKDKPWMAEVSVPSYISIPLLLPVQKWFDRFGDNVLAVIVVVGVKGIIYGAVVFCIGRFKNLFVRSLTPWQ